MATGNARVDKIDFESERTSSVSEKLQTKQSLLP